MIGKILLPIIWHETGHAIFASLFPVAIELPDGVYIVEFQSKHLKSSGK